MLQDSTHNITSVLRVSILSLLDKRVSKILQQVAEKNPQNCSIQTIPSISVNILIYNTQSKGTPIRLILVQPQTHDFTEKLIKRFYEASCAIFLFDANDYQSFTAAKVFYTSFKETHKNKNFPIAFIELVNDSEEDFSTEPELLDGISNVSYYAMKDSDFERFESILGNLKDQYFTQNFQSSEIDILEKLFQLKNKNEL